MSERDRHIDVLQWVHAQFLIRRDEASGQREAEGAQLCADATSYAVATIKREKRLRGLFWFAWSVMNDIRAESGVPHSYDGTKKFSEDYWSNLVDAMAEELGDDARPWPSDDAVAVLHEEWSE